MRKVIYGINITADGYCDHTLMSGGEDIHNYFTDLMKDADLIVYGRKTYELMVPYWPNVAKDPSAPAPDLQFARTFSAIDKIVFSRSLDKVEGNARLLRSDPGEELLRLKQQPGKNISIGGIDLPAQLIALGLVDEFYLVVHPVIAGGGRRLLEGARLEEALHLKLAGSEALPSGCVALHYVKQ